MGILPKQIMRTEFFLLFLFSLFNGTFSCSSTPSLKREAKVTIVSDSGDTNGITGEITFTQEEKDSPIRISGTVRNLPAGGHGFHVHEKKHTGTDCSTAGGHFNPENTSHGSLTAKIRHAGDFGSIYADASGVATFDFETGSSGSS